jgi:hypothetical protein
MWKKERVKTMCHYLLDLRPDPQIRRSLAKKKNIKERKEKQKQLVKITKMFPHNLSKLRQIDNLLELKSTDNSQIELDPMESRSVKKTIGARTEAHNMKITTFLRIIVSIFIVCSPETSHLSLLLGCAKSN